MDDANNNDRNNDNDSANVTHVATACVTTNELFTVNTLPSAPDLFNDELVALQLKDTNENNYFAPYQKPPKGKVNANNFEKRKKSSKSIAPIPSGSIKKMFYNKSQTKRTAAHQIFNTQLKFNY